MRRLHKHKTRRPSLNPARLSRLPAPPPREAFEDPACLELVLAGRSAIEKMRANGAWTSEEEHIQGVVYMCIKMGELSYNEHIKATAAQVAAVERILALRIYFEVAQSLRAATRSKDNYIPPQYYLAALYVVVEGFKQLQLGDPKIDELCRSPHLRVLKKLRDSVFHYQEKRLNNRLLAFLTEDCFNWAKQLRAEITRWLADNAPPDVEATIGGILNAIGKVAPFEDGATIQSSLKEFIAASMNLALPEFEAKYETLSTNRFPIAEVRSVVQRLSEENKFVAWPMIDALKATLRSSDQALRPINIESMAEEHARVKGSRLAQAGPLPVLPA